MHFFFYFLIATSLLQDCALFSSERHKERQENTVSHCIYCWKEFSNKHACEQHEQLAHKKDQSYRCSCCGYSFQTKEGRAQHQGICKPFLKPGQMDRLVAGEDIEIKGPDFWCEHCGKGFKTKDGALKHEEEKHGKDGDTQYQCLCCGQSFEVAFERSKHQGNCYPHKNACQDQKNEYDREDDKKNSNKKEKKCLFCGKFFNGRGFKNHMRFCQEQDQKYDQSDEEEEQEDLEFRKKRAAISKKKCDKKYENKFCRPDDQSFRCLHCKEIIPLGIKALASQHTLGSCTIREITHKERVFKCLKCGAFFPENAIESHSCSQNQGHSNALMNEQVSFNNNVWPSLAEQGATAAAAAVFGYSGNKITNDLSLDTFAPQPTFSVCGVCNGEIASNDSDIWQQHQNNNHALSTLRGSSAAEDFQYSCKVCNLYVEPHNASIHGNGLCVNFWGNSVDQHQSLYQQNLAQQGQSLGFPQQNHNNQLSSGQLERFSFEEE